MTLIGTGLFREAVIETRATCTNSCHIETKKKKTVLSSLSADLARKQIYSTGIGDRS